MTLFGVSVGRNRGVSSRFPHILWRYSLPRWLNCKTWTPGQPKHYQWLWWCFSIPYFARKYWIPRWLNCVTWTPGRPRVYQWLWKKISIQTKAPTVQ